MALLVAREVILALEAGTADVADEASLERVTEQMLLQELALRIGHVALWTAVERRAVQCGRQTDLAWNFDNDLLDYRTVAATLFLKNGLNIQILTWLGSGLLLLGRLLLFLLLVIRRHHDVGGGGGGRCDGSRRLGHLRLLLDALRRVLEEVVEAQWQRACG